MTEGAKPDSDGRVKVCSDCLVQLQEQWTEHEQAGRPLLERQYWLTCCQAVCEVCGERVFVRQSDSAPGIYRINFMSTADDDGDTEEMLLPVGSWLCLHAGAVLSAADQKTVMACRNCHQALMKHHTLFNSIGLPPEQRHYGSCLKRQVMCVSVFLTVNVCVVFFLWGIPKEGFVQTHYRSI